MTIPMIALSDLASDLAGEFALEPLLERILRNAVRLLGCTSGSICTIDESRRVYRKEVDLDVGCRSGEVFSLDEGVTGAIVRSGGAVCFRHYSAVPFGHIRSDDVRYSRAVLGVPIRLKSTIIGALMVFGGDAAREFGNDDVHTLELFAIHGGVALANSLLVTEASAGATRSVSASPIFRSQQAPFGRLTARECQVRSLVERGWPDKRVAVELGISVKTVEKHVGGILRKTGAGNRTELAALARASG